MSIVLKENIPYERRKRNNRGEYRFIVKKRNLTRKYMPGDMIMFDNEKHYIDAIREVDSYQFAFYAYLAPEEQVPTFLQWLYRHNPKLPIRIANSFNFSVAQVYENPHELVTPKYEWLHNKKVMQVKKERHVINLWLKSNYMNRNF